MIAMQRLSVVSNDLPDAPYPPTVKANGFRPEVDWQRIKSSKTWRLCPQDQRNNLLRLWLESWNEVPAGSWENDDELIAAAIDVPLRLFVAHRDILMRGWRQHSDGRLYHPVVTELVLAMLCKRTSAAERQRQKREREREADKEKQEVIDVCHGLVTRDSGVSHAQEQEQEQDITPKPPVGDPFALPPEVDPAAWSDFVQHRREIKKPLKGLAATKNANLLASMSMADQREAVDATIRNRWTGLFPPKRKPGDSQQAGYRGARV